MSDSGYPPPPNDPQQPNPYGQSQGQPNPYGAPPPQPGANPYGSTDPYAQAAYGAVAPGGYAHWGKRVGSYLIDYLLVMVGYIPALIGGAISGSQPDGTSMAGTLLSLIGFGLAIAIFVWNTCLQAGRTGYSVGKGVMGIKLINEGTQQPIGAGMAFLRALLHILDSLPCYLGFLWPLWDAKRQTFADKIISSVVINQPKG
ncbi:RDD family protein [Nocardioides sp.]|uniref:RDD family protein n=1 Tax=Nocardioides sp. TaxID=35761 RepID=UPI003569F5B6